MTTGIIWSDRYPEEGHMLLKERLKPAFNYLKTMKIFENPNIKLYEPIPASEEIIQKIHTKDMLVKVKATGYYEIAKLTAGGCALAGELIWKGEINNAFAFTAAAGHHASKDFFWGFCYINNAAVLVETLKEKHKVKKFLIVDTDPHFGDGTWEIFENDENVFHLEFHGGGPLDPKFGKNSVSVPLPSESRDEHVLYAVEKLLEPIAENFGPEILIWEFGHDAHHQDYGAWQLTVPGFTKIAKTLVKTSKKICDGKLIVLLSGGSNENVAKLSIYGIVSTLAEIPFKAEDTGYLPEQNTDIKEEISNVVKKNVEKVLKTLL